MVITPVTAVSSNAGVIACPISFSFWDSFFATDKIGVIINFKIQAPASAGNPVTITTVKNIEVTNKLPTRTVMLFAAFEPSSKYFLFFIRVLDKELISVIIVFNFSIDFGTIFDSNDAMINFIIDLFNDEISSLRFFAASFAFSNVDLFSFKVFEINSKDASSPTNIFFNFSIVLNLVSVKTFILIFDSESIILGAELMTLSIFSKSFLFIFKFSFDFLSILVKLFNFNFP